MEPTTLALIAGFLIPPAPTRFEDWVAHMIGSSDSYRTEVGSTWLLVSPSSELVPSEAMAAGNLSTDIVPDRLHALEMELNLYATLPEGWDGPESKVPEASDIEAAQEFLTKLPAGTPIPKAMLSSTGKVGLYWDTAAVFADIAFEGAGAFSLFTRQKEGNQETFDDNVHLDHVTSEWLAQKLVPALNA